VDRTVEKGREGKEWRDRGRDGEEGGG